LAAPAAAVDSVALAAVVPREPVVPALADPLVLALLLVARHAPAPQALAQWLVVRTVLRALRPPQGPELAGLVQLPVPAALLPAAAASAASAAVELLSHLSSSAAMARSTP
jgi:hypothetical protein